MSWPVDYAPFSDNRTPLLVGLDAVGRINSVPVAVDPNTGELLVYSFAGFSLPAYDYIALNQTTLTDVYTFYSGGSGGTLVATITITYTDSGKSTIANVAKT